MRFGAFVGALALMASAGQAYAYCSEPSFYEMQPTAPRTYTKPSVPFCLSSYSFSRTHTCSQWELDAYKREVADYIEDLNDYLSDAIAFADAATLYVREAESYARCEADEVSTQHE